MYFPQGSTNQILTMLGAPNASYPGLLDILDYNSNYSLWVSAPPGVMTGVSNYYGGVYFTKEANIEDFYQVTDPENPNFLIKVVAGSTSPYSTASDPVYALTDLTVDNIPDEYFSTNVGAIYVEYPDSETGEAVITKLKIDGTDIVDFTTGLITAGTIATGTAPNTSKIVIDGAAGIATIDFDNDTDLDSYLGANGDDIQVYWELNIEDQVLQTIYQISPRSTPTTLVISKVDKATQVEGETNPAYNTVAFSATELTYGNTYYSTGNLLGSPDMLKKDGFGASIFMGDVLDGNPILYGQSYGSFADATGTWPVAPVTKTLVGTRAIENALFDDDDLLATMQQGWTEAQDSRYADVKMFFDPENLDDLATNFSALRASTYPFSTFVSGIKVASSNATTAVSQIKAARSGAPNSSGIAYYCNEFMVKETYSGTSFWKIPVGSVAAMLTRIMDVRRGGAAPMWTNAGNPALGGQLERVVKKQKYSFSADQLDEMDAAGVNPIIFDSFYGLMITSQRTGQSPITLTDWSYLGHSMAFDLFKDEIRRNVMIPQIGKPIDNFYMELRTTQAQIILNKRLIGETPIWDSGIVLVKEVNTDETKIARDFRIKIRVKVNPFSEYVTLVFNNVAQNSSVEEE